MGDAGKRKLAGAASLAACALVVMALALAPAGVAEAAELAAGGAPAQLQAQAKAKLTVVADKKVKYTGKAVKPKLVVRASGKKLKAGRDYEVTYLGKSGKRIPAGKVRKPGSYRVKVTGKGAYAGAAATARFAVWSKGGRKWVPTYRKVKVVERRTVVDSPACDRAVPAISYAGSCHFADLYPTGAARSCMTCSVFEADPSVLYYHAGGSFPASRSFYYDTATGAYVCDAKSDMSAAEKRRLAAGGIAFGTFNDVAAWKASATCTLRMPPALWEDMSSRFAGDAFWVMPTWSRLLGSVQACGYDSARFARAVIPDDEAEAAELEEELDAMMPWIRRICESCDNTDSFIQSFVEDPSERAGAYGFYWVTGNETRHFAAKTHVVKTVRYKKVCTGGRWR